MENFLVWHCLELVSVVRERMNNCVGEGGKNKGISKYSTMRCFMIVLNYEIFLRPKDGIKNDRTIMRYCVRRSPPSSWSICLEPIPPSRIFIQLGNHSRNKGRNDTIFCVSTVNINSKLALILASVSKSDTEYKKI